MEVRLRFRHDERTEVTRVLTYQTDDDHLHVGEFIRLQPDNNGVMVVLRIVKITHIKLVVESVVRQKPKLADLRLLVLVQPAHGEEGRVLPYSDLQLIDVGFQPI